MTKTRMHAKRPLSYDPQTEGVVWTKCLRHVEQAQVAAFPEGVTCKQCLKHLADEAQWERERAERLARKEVAAT